MAIGDKLTELMELRKTNPNQLSKSTGVNVNTIYGIIRRNNTKVNLDDLQSLCDELGVNLDYFADREPVAFSTETEKPATPEGNGLDDDTKTLLKIYLELPEDDRELLIQQAELLMQRRKK